MSKPKLWIKIGLDKTKFEEAATRRGLRLLEARDVLIELFEEELEDLDRLLVAAKVARLRRQADELELLNLDKRGVVGRIPLFLPDDKRLWPENYSAPSPEDLEQRHQISTAPWMKGTGDTILKSGLILPAEDDEPERSEP